MSKLLTAVERSARRRREAEQAFRAALREAHPEHSYREIAAAAGMSRMGVKYLMNPDPRKEQADGRQA